MGAAVIPFAFAGQIGIDLGLGILGGEDLLWKPCASTADPLAPGALGTWEPCLGVMVGDLCP